MALHVLLDQQLIYGPLYNHITFAIFFSHMTGTDKTYQLANIGHYGGAFKIVPMFDDRKGHYTGCWHLSGIPRVPIVVQPIVPNMTTFKVRYYTRH